jgi:predicted DNA-binding transcriptional regulator AlpA
MNIADEMDERIDKFMADNKLPESLRVQFRAAAWIGASIANEMRMEEERDGI